MMCHSQSTEISYTVRRSKVARHLRLTVYPGGQCVLTVPRRCSVGDAEQFVVSRRRWLEQTVTRMRAFPPRPQRRRWSAAARQEALRLFTELVHAWNRHYGFRIRGIRVRDMCSRWGSCSRTGMLTFNLRLLEVSPPLQAYVAVHELCHLGEPHHGPSFWQLVEKAMPAYHEHRRQLRTLRHR